ncbi:MAG: HAD family hydrolase [Bacilli bacterium]
MIKAVIFDLDGTLVDTISDLSNALNLSLKQNGYDISYTVEQTKALVGSGIRDLCKKAIEKITDKEEDITRLLSSFIANYDLMQIETSKPYEGIMELLEYLKQKNIKIAVFSNKKYENTLYIVENLFKKNTFDVVYGKKDGYPLKPDTRALNFILNDLKVTKEEVLYVGDSDVDMKTAINGGLVKVAVTYGYRDKEILLTYNPQYVVSSPLEIKKIIENEDEL